MTAILILAGLLALACLACYAFAKSARTWATAYASEHNSRLAAEKRLSEFASNVRHMEEDRHAAEIDKAALATGTPRDRLDASIDLLRESAKDGSARAPSDGVARSTPPARDRN